MTNVMDAREHYLGYMCKGHVVIFDHVTKQKVWKEVKPKDMLEIEPYVFSDEQIQPIHKGYILEVSKEQHDAVPIQPKQKGPSQYQQFMKEKIPEYATLYPNMTKKERYNLIIAEWKKSQEESKKKSSPK